MLQNSSLRAHEDFSLTGNLLEVTSEWQKKSNLGSFGARIVNLTCTPFTALIDAAAHLALGTFTVCGGSLIGGSIWNFGIHLAGRNRWSVLRFEGGLINLINALQHTIGIVVIPIIGFISPEIAAKKFNGSQNAKIELLQQQNRKVNKLEKNNVAHKNLVEKLRKKKNLLEDRLENKNKQIENLVNANIENKQNISTLKLDLKSRDLQIVECNETISSQQELISKLMAEVELKNRQLVHQKNIILDLKDAAEFQEPTNDDEYEEKIELLNKNHALEIKSKDLNISLLTAKKIELGKSITELNLKFSKIPKEIKKQYFKDTDQSKNETTEVPEVVKPSKSVLYFLPVVGSFF